MEFLLEPHYERVSEPISFNQFISRKKSLFETSPFLLINAENFAQKKIVGKLNFKLENLSIKKQNDNFIIENEEIDELEELDPDMFEKKEVPKVVTKLSTRSQKKNQGTGESDTLEQREKDFWSMMQSQNLHKAKCGTNVDDDLKGENWNSFLTVMRKKKS
jgi:predicted RND superfamily exporter protein